jgi:hypothetical protein
MLAEAQLKFWKDFRQDVIMLENGVIAEAEACGSVAAYSDEQPARIVEHVLAGGLEKIDELEVPDPNTAFPMCEVIKATRILAHEIGKEVYIMGRSSLTIQFIHDLGGGLLTREIRCQRFPEMA